jgi:hypothetical protein
MDERLPHTSEKQPRSRLARLAGRDTDFLSQAVQSPNPGLSYSKSQYKSLYKINLKKELEDWDLPFAVARKKPSGALISNTKLPPLPYEESNEEDEQSSRNQEFDMRALTKMLSKSKKSTSGIGSGAQ